MATKAEIRERLEELLYSGSQSTTIDGESVTFRSQSDIIALLEHLNNSDPTYKSNTSSANANVAFNGIY